MNYWNKAIDEFMGANNLEFNKKFRVDGYETEFYIDGEYLLFDNDGWRHSHLLTYLLRGGYKVKKNTLEQKLLDHPTFKGWQITEKGNVFMVGGSDAWGKEYLAGNVFETQAEAEKEKARRILNRKLREWKYENDPEKPKAGEDTIFGIMGHRDPKNKNITPYIDGSKVYPYFSEFGVYFTSTDAARRALNAFREELTDYFNMED